MALPASRSKTKVASQRPAHVPGFAYHIEKRVVNGCPGAALDWHVLAVLTFQSRLSNPDSIYVEKAA
jgi:hypothetical protein